MTSAMTSSVAEACSPSHLITQSNFSEPGARHRQAYAAGDAFYQALIDAHAGLDEAGSQRLNVRLVLLLSNHIGDLGVLREALTAARRGLA